MYLAIYNIIYPAKYVIKMKYLARYKERAQ